MISDFEYLKISSNNLPRIGIGTGAFFSSFTWGEQSKKDSICAIQCALDVGIRFIDTGATYGNGSAEEIIGEAIKGCREKAFIATKVPEIMLQKGKIEESCDASLRRLNIDYLDLYQIHWINDLVNIDEIIDELLKLKQNGKVRNLGMGNCGKQMADKFPNDFVTNQLPYSLVWRGLENNISDSISNLEANVFYYCLGQGLLSGKYKNLNEFPQSRKRTRLFDYMKINARHKEKGYEKCLEYFLISFASICEEHNIGQVHAALGWILYRYPNSIALVGLRNENQVKHISSIKKMDSMFYDELTVASEKLKDTIGNKMDLWDSIERIK